MEEYQFRVLQERVQLEERLDKLKAFIDTEDFVKVFWKERIRMRSQALFMELYLDILKQRIKHFEGEE